MRLTPLSISQILKAADDYYAREKKWPQAKSAGFVACNTEQVTWRNVDQALRKGLRKLPAGSSLAMLLAQHRGVRNRKALPRLSVRQILFWADLHQERTGEWPTRESGPIEEAPGETWCAAEMALCHGQRGLPGGFSLAWLLAERRQRPLRNNRPPLTLAQILAWADAYHARTNRWPLASSGAIPESPGDTWHAMNNALRNGRRGLPGGFSLAQLLADQRSAPNHHRLPQLTIKQVLLWADVHHRRLGRWPKASSGPILCSGGETWSRIDTALRQGNRGLPGNTSLAQVLAAQRGARMGSDSLPLSFEQILAWADAHHASTGAWPHHRMGALLEAPNESWRTLNCALRDGRRGLPGGSTLHRLLVEYRNIENAAIAGSRNQPGGARRSSR
ncbi:MAG TPA: hypothetical protein VG099_10370 [Gemmataceae bacterium]|nr:hypothetical protein [Gemmataceae bacterium]